jgi:tetratricopeptide (TPR) repeat protein
LAYHYARTDKAAKAVEYLTLVAERAARNSANVEAIGHLTKGLEVLQALPDTPERMRQELTLHIALGAALIATKGYTAPEVEQVYNRALELCQQEGKISQLFLVLRGFQVCYFVRAELQKTRELGEQLLTLAERQQHPALLLEAQPLRGIPLMYLGELSPARAYFEQGIALYDSQKHRSHAVLYGQDPGVVCLTNVALTLWMLDSSDQARQRSHEALALAQELSHPYSRAYALYFAARLHQCRREVQEAQERAEAVMTLSAEYGFALWLTGE